MKTEMDRYYRYTIRLTLLFLTLLYNIRGEAKLSDKYTEQRPLTMVCDWELPPYEFFNDVGEPSGYTIDLLTIILDKLKIPYKFVPREKPMDPDSLKNISDIFILSEYYPVPEGFYVTSNAIYYYKMMLAMRNETPPVASITSIPAGHLLVSRLDGRISALALKHMSLDATIEFHAPMEALSGVSSGKYDYFFWGEQPLKWKIRELNLENLKLVDLNLPAAELRLASKDEELIDAIDNQFARLEQEGELSRLHDRWFHPERHHDNASPIVLYTAIATILLLLTLFLIHRLAQLRVKKMTRRSSEQTRVMDMALNMGGYMVTEYNAKQDKFKNLRGHLIDETSTMADTIKSLHQDDHQAFMSKAEELRKRETTTSELMVRRNTGTSENPQWQHLKGSCIREQDEDTHHTTFLLVTKDVTKEMDEQESNNEMAAKYMKAFDSALVAMSFYSSDGKLLDMNERMKEVIGVNEENQEFFFETKLFDAPLFKGVLFPGMENTVHACQHMYYPDIHLDKYLEYRVRPVRNEQSEIIYYAVTVRDVTSERSLYREQQSIKRQLDVTSEEVQKFEKQMNYLLSNCKMFIWRTNPQTRMVELSRSLHKVDYTFSYDDYINSVAAEEKESGNATLYNPLMKNKPFNIIRHYSDSILSHHEAWYAISGMPVYDKNGKAQGHFGTVRDITQLMRSQEELRNETQRAQQSGQMKAAFLANMTHEIRTPLNAIVGFSDVLHMVEDPEERKEYINIIRHNCDLLLRLIDDILETSNMDEKVQSIQPEDTDFATFFDELCQVMAERVHESSVSFIKDNPYSTFPASTDKERIQQVITNFVTNSVKYTKEGHIKVGYREERREIRGEKVDGIYIYCEDTGAGIPKEKQASVFDRFVKLNDYVQGTGLGLSICKAIADRCGGRIGVVSEGDGKGSTFWIWIPRFLTSSNYTAEK